MAPGDSVCVVVGDDEVVSARVVEPDVVIDPVEDDSCPSRAIAVVPVRSNESDEVGATSDRICAVEPVNLTVDVASVVAPGSVSRALAVVPVNDRRESEDVEPAVGRSVAVDPVPVEPVPRSLAVRLDPTPSLGVVSVDVADPAIPETSDESGLTRAPAYAATAK